MRLFKHLLAAVLTGAIFASCSAKTTTEQNQTSTDMKAVVIYFTHSGNTELAANDLAKEIGCKAIRLYPEQPYSSADVDWVNEQSRCTQEHLNQSLRPAIKPVDVDFNDINTVFIGFPIWWHEEPAVIRTFLDKYGNELQGKNIYPFCTSYESPMSEADATLHKGYLTLNIKKGLRFPANSKEIKDWVNQ